MKVENHNIKQNGKTPKYKIDVKINFNYFNFNVVHGGIDYEPKFKKKKKKRLSPGQMLIISRLPTKVYWEKKKKNMKIS